ncbi:hypothetical protein ACIU1J_06010 [Azospirillum doebereinerae]|uniref:hypothetical protein n=1 Tax=Azospirillum doebereinerae TaxID=92933 RepID=UPI001EE586C6|nr:hypothetical protein [Azospirillum doebereinerae]MCG5239770.1 hypothetical protein [Azospirillum doebereinerae]
MSGSGFGSSEFTIRSTGAIERTGSATERHRQGNPRQERRDRNPPNPQRRRIYDLLFDEVDRFDDLDERQREKLKANLRDHLTARVPLSPSALPSEPDEGSLPGRLLDDSFASVPVDADHIVAAAAGSGPVTPEEEADNALLASQLRDCLDRHTDRARKVAVYLHLLLSIDGAERPHTIMDV